MAATFLDIAITPDVMDVQHEMGSDQLWQNAAQPPSGGSLRRQRRGDDRYPRQFLSGDGVAKAAGPTFSIAAARRVFCACWMTPRWPWPISAVIASTSPPATCAAATGPASF